MPDRYQPLRDAIAAGPTRGPWKSMSVRSGYYIQSASVPAVVVDTTDAEGRYGAIANEADAALIAAADPDTIAALLKERDDWRRQAHYETDIAQAAVDEITRLKAELHLIADTDPADAALDPQRAVRIARAALADGEATNGS